MPQKDPTLETLTIDPATRATATDAAAALKTSMSKLFGDNPAGALPNEGGPMITPAGVVPASNTGPTGAAATGAPGATGAAATGDPVGPTGAATGATGAAATGATGAAATGVTGVAATGATGATGEPLSPVEKLAKELADMKDPTKVAAAAEAKKKADADAAAKAAGKLTEDEQDEVAKTMTEKAGTVFKQLRGDKRTLSEANEKLSTDLAAANKQIEELKTGAADPAQVAELQKKIDRYELELGAVKVEATAEFQDRVTKPEAAITSELSSIASKYKINEGELKSALSEPDVIKRNDRLAELTGEAITNRFDNSRFERLVTELDEVGKTRAQLLASAATKAEKLTATQSAEAEARKAEVTSQWKNSLTQVRQKLAQNNPLFRPSEDETWNTDLKKALDDGEAVDITKLSNDELAEAIYQRNMYPMLINLITQLYGRTATLNSALTKLRQTGVKAGDGDQPGHVIVQEKPKTFQEAAKTRLDGILPR